MSVSAIGILYGIVTLAVMFSGVPIAFSLGGVATLFMLVCAFAGREFMIDCYRQAIAEQYRFFSYGDCMLIL